MPSLSGAIVVDKPSGWTSHDVVGKLRRIADTRKVGHLGTLDPLATGVLPMLLNRATRLAQFFTLNDKAYEGTIRFGFSTDSYDADGKPTSTPVSRPVSVDEVERVMAQFRGTIMQVPPAVSAKKVDGRKAYELARKNVKVELPPVEVTVHELDVLGTSGDEARIRIRCSAGTYVRSIAHDAGLALGCGAHLTQLRRIASGPFTLAQARSIDELTALAEQGRLEEALIPAASLLPEIPMEVVDTIAEAQIRNGRDFRVSPFRDRGNTRHLKAVSTDGELVAIGEIVLPNLYHPVLVM